MFRLALVTVSLLSAIQPCFAAPCAPGDSGRPLTRVEKLKLNVKLAYSQLLAAELSRDAYLVNIGLGETAAIASVIAPAGLGIATGKLLKEGYLAGKTVISESGVAANARLMKQFADGAFKTNVLNFVKNLKTIKGGLKISLVAGVTTIVAIAGARTIMHVFSDPAQMRQNREELNAKIEAIKTKLAQGVTCAQ